MEVKAKTLYEYGHGAIANQPGLGDYKYFEPVRRGVVEDVDRLERLLDYVFSKELNLKNTTSLNLLMTMAPNNSKENMKDLCELMFEKFKIASLSL